MKEIIKKKASEYLKKTIEIRRYLHSHPELSSEEYHTSEFIVSKLKEMDIPCKILANTGIVGLIKGKNPQSKVVALRTDMDALPIEEENDVSYKSVNKGVMHACGHDVHMASLLGTAMILVELKENFNGTVKLIFQPSEEKFPGGAVQMIKEGVLTDPDTDIIIGQHVLPTLQAGKIGIKSGKYMASTDEIYITVRGKGGHGATPDMIIDPVLIASHIIVALQQIVSRNATPGIPTVLSFGRFIANGRTNIIPDEVKIEGTIRTFDEHWRLDAHKKIKLMAQSLAESMGGTCEVFIDKGYPFLVNDFLLTEKIRKSASDFLGKVNVVEQEMRMTAEDFAYYAQKIPACFYRLGVKNEQTGKVSNLHTPTFDVDDEILETAMGLMAWIAIYELS